MSFDKNQNANKGADINKAKQDELNRQNQTKTTQDKSNLGQDKARPGSHDTANKGGMGK